MIDTVTDMCSQHVLSMTNNDNDCWFESAKSVEEQRSVLQLLRESEGGSPPAGFSDQSGAQEEENNFPTLAALLICEV